MGEFFGTDGIRGVAGQFPLDAPNIERIGYSLAMELRARLDRSPLIIIGRDTRESGEWIEAAIVRGIHTAHAEAQSAGVITTPGVAYLTRALKADAGVVLSASHNPYQDNGIKVFAPSGQKLDDATEQAIERDLKADPASFPPMVSATIKPDESLNSTESGSDRLKEKYFNFLREEIGAGLDLRQQRIVVDCASGASYEIAPLLFASLGALVTAINIEPDGRNINLDCGSLHPERLQEVVLKAEADLGIAFDGDADRALFVDERGQLVDGDQVLFVDERGQLVDGDQVLFVMAEYLAARNKLAGRRVVATVMSNLGLELALRQRDINLARAQVGDKYVLEELLRGGGSIGGEQSGHIIFPEISLAGDGMITALEVVRVMAESGQSLSQLTSGFTRYPQVIINVRVARKPPLDSIAPIKTAVAALEEQLDGKGRLLLRYSGTENLARVMIEGQDEATIRRQAKDLAEIIKDNLS